MHDDDYNWISRRAHAIWQSEGCPNGRDRDHWSQVVNDWRDKQHALASTAPTDEVRRVLVVDDEASDDDGRAKRLSKH
ncbi:DUF2934 domain-containing protein [Rhizobium sp. 21-4511-3d]